jgi:hypothetical protein
VYDVETKGFVPWDEPEPITVKMRGQVISAWTMRGGNADDPPQIPPRSSDGDVDVELVPYGCTRLRVSEFPVFDEEILRGE